jgi:predicted DNA-binding transcriptional regulator AlpA
MPQFWVGALDLVLDTCPSLTALRISADFITNEMFSSLYIQSPHPLRILDVECSPTTEADVGISASAIYDAVEDGRLPDLRSVRVSARLAWGATEGTRTDASDLGEILEEAEMERPLSIATGVWWNMPD